jgi:hypothetical protein
MVTDLLRAIFGLFDIPNMIPVFTAMLASGVPLTL